MSSATAFIPETPSAPPIGDGRPTAERDLAILSRVAEIGLDILETIRDQAKGGPVVVQGDLALAYDRVTRALRHTLMLKARLIEARQDFEMGRAGRKAAFGAEAARIVRRVIEDDAGLDAQKTERLTSEAAERLRAEDVGDLYSRPFGEAVAGICRTLDLSPDWLKLAQDCYAAEAAITGKPGAAPKAADDWDGRYEVQWLSSGSNDSS